MPLSQTNKQQSQSIEDLIAQLDAPPIGEHQKEISNGSRHHSHGSENNSENNHSDRKMLKGKRMLGSTGDAASDGGDSSSNEKTHSPSFVKTNSFGQNSEPILSRNIISSKKYTKNSRSLKSLPKKGGAGGKGTWGAPGCELTEEEFIDTKDPNYDSDEDKDNVVMVCVENRDDTAARGGIATPSTTGSTNLDHQSSESSSLKELTVEDLENEIKLVVLEYFQNGDTIEVIDHLKCFNLNGNNTSQLIAYLIQIALEHNNTCKELTSRLLRDLTVELVDERDFVTGFDLVLKNLSDLILDNPEAPEKIGTFIARAIADKVISKTYIDRVFQTAVDCKNGDDCEEQQHECLQKALDSARLLVNMNDHLFHLSHIWGHKGGFSAVRELSDKINELIQEYHDSGDIEEAIRCLKELNVPHFNHEFVYEALDFALQKGDDHAIDLIINLLQRLCQAAIVTYDQLKMGFIRIFDVFPDIILDVPNANALIDKFLSKGHSKGFISEDIMDLAPSRSRKRFVSEGDGGRIKNNNGY